MTTIHILRSLLAPYNEAHQDGDVKHKKGKKRALEDLPREIKPPTGDWFDKHGTGHRSHALACENINARLEKAWVVADAISKVQTLCSSSSVSAPSMFASTLDVVDLAANEDSVVSTGLALPATAITGIATLIHSHSEDGKKLHVTHKCGAAVARFFEEDDPLRQGADGDRLKRAMKAAKQDEEKRRKPSSSSFAPGRSSSRPSREGRSSSFSERRSSRVVGSYEYRDRARDRGGDRKCFYRGGQHLANECHKRRK